MSRKYDMGAYHLILFNKVGAKLKTEYFPDRMLDAEKRGEELLNSDPEVESYVILRCIYNSLRVKESWNPT